MFYLVSLNVSDYSTDRIIDNSDDLAALEAQHEIEIEKNDDSLYRITIVDENDVDQFSGQQY